MRTSSIIFALVIIISFSVYKGLAVKTNQDKQVKSIAMKYYKLGWYHGVVHTCKDSMAMDYCFKQDSLNLK